MKQIFIALLTLTTIASFGQNKKTTTAPDSWSKMAIKAKEMISPKTPDGAPYTSDILRKGSPPEKISLNITGQKELVLFTWSTYDGNGYDHSVWANAKMIRRDGSVKWLDEAAFKFQHADDPTWIRRNKSFSGIPFLFSKEQQARGVLVHANGIVIVDLTDGDYVRFEATIGIDDGSTSRGSVVFRVAQTDGKAEATALTMLCPQVRDIITQTFGVSLEQWLTTPGLTLQNMALENAIRNIGNKQYFHDEHAKLLAMTDKAKQLEGYVTLIDKTTELLTIRQNLEWLNVDAVGAAMKDMQLGDEYQQKYAELKRLAKIGFEGVDLLDATSIANAKRAIALKREILMANPLLDMDKLIVTHYKLGERARRVEPDAMGTQPSNWSCQLSSARSGYDAEIIEMSNLRAEKVSIRSLYKPDGDRLVTDVQLHWDASRMIFTSQDRERRFQIYEIPYDNDHTAPPAESRIVFMRDTQARQVTQIGEPDLEFFDAAYLPSGKLIVGSNMGYQGVPCVSGSDPVGNFALYDPATNQMRRLCFDQDNNWNPVVMANGRVLYTRWEYTDLMHYYSRIVMNMNPDGTENKAFYGSGSLFPNSTFDLAPMPGSSNSFMGIISGHHGVIRSGRLIIFDINKSRKGAEGMVQEIPFSKREIVPVVKDELVNDVWPQFIKPHPINDKYFLVTAKLTPESLWGIYLVDVFDNMTLIVEIEGEGLINPIPVIKRPVPPVIPERVPMDLSDANMESTVFIQDIYEGGGLPNVPRGTVKEIRVLAYEYAYLHSPSDHIAMGIQSGWDIKRELGRVKVEEDGSVMFKIPANTPISLQPLDENGAAIQLMRSWLTGQPGETVSCIGCHEDQSQIPMPKRTIASTKKPVAITPPEGGVRPFTFELEIQPILDRACVACHNGELKKGGIDYTGGRYDSLSYGNERYLSKSYLQFHPYFYRQGPEAEMAVLNPMEYHIDNSEMIQMLRNGHHGVKLTPKEWERLTTWVDFNLPYHGVFKDVTLCQDRTQGVIDQKSRRIELSRKYANNPIEWEKEVAAYAAYLETQPKPKPELPTTTLTDTKQIKVKGFPFTAQQAKEMVANKERKVVDLGNGQKMTFVYIPRGEYVAGGDGRGATLATHKVKIEKGFWMSETETTNGQMRAIMPAHDSRYIGQFWKDHTTPGYYVNYDEFSATKVSYDEAMQFAAKLSAQNGLKVTLPTEDQWEWAARAGSDSDFWYGTLNTDFSPYENLADTQLTNMAVSGIDPQPMNKTTELYRFLNYIPKEESVDDGMMLVGAPAKYRPNPWGLYDMHGNVAEWTRSAYGSDDRYRVVRGGSWYDRPKKATAATRREFIHWQKVWNVGVRFIIEE